MTANSDRSAYFYEDTKWRLRFSLMWIGLLLAVLVALLCFAGMTDSRIFTAVNFQNLMGRFLIIALLAPAIVMIVGAGGLDLSVGSVIALASVVACAAASRGTPMPTSAFMGVGAAFLVGLLNGSLVGLTRIPGFIITFATAALAGGIAVAASGGGMIVLEDSARHTLEWLSVLAWGLLILVGIGSVLLVQLTPFGRRPSPGPAEEVELWLARACFTGVPYLLSALMAGVGGLLLVYRLSAVSPTIGSQTAVHVIGIVIVGGTCFGGRFGSVIGALLAAFMFVFLQNVLNFLETPEYVQQIVLASVFLAGAVLCHGFYSLTQFVYRRQLRNS